MTCRCRHRRVVIIAVCVNLTKRVIVVTMTCRCRHRRVVIIAVCVILTTCVYLDLLDNILTCLMKPVLSNT